MGPGLKGKSTNRSWPQLPDEIVWTIASHYIMDRSTASYSSMAWSLDSSQGHAVWFSRMVYQVLRDAQDLERYFMPICPEWRKAIEKHPFWNEAVNVVDPNDFLKQHMIFYPKPHPSQTSLPPPVHLTAYRHLRNIISCSCYVCRVNNPRTNMGLTTAKHLIASMFHGNIPVCKEHYRRRDLICGVCLCDGLPLTQDLTAREYELAQNLAVVDNDDLMTFPNIAATCKTCRKQYLWNAVCSNARDIEAVGGRAFLPDDWEAAHHVSAFIDLGEGNLKELISLAREKLWLCRFTKYKSLAEHALAAQKTEEEDEGDEEEEADSDDEREVLLMRDSSQVREMALYDWARQRIMDGHWLSPADAWYRNTVHGAPTSVPAVHPCPWTRTALRSSTPGSSVDGAGDFNAEEEEVHPSPSIVNAAIPPTYDLCEIAYGIHTRQLREILTPPMKNVVRKLVMECSMESSKGYEDPATKASRMSLEEVIKILREDELVWYDGVDWVERKRNEEASRHHGHTEDKPSPISKDRTEDDSLSTTSSGSSVKSSSHTSSNTTSPVLSTSTLQTTPSPPPSTDESVTKKDDETPRRASTLPTRPRLIPVDPVKPSPQLLSSIPYIPVTIAHLPMYTIEGIKTAWRDACAPLYHCRCSICERAKMADAAARAAYANVGVVQSEPTNRQYHGDIHSGEIQLKEVQGTEIDGDGEEEVDYEASDAEYDGDGLEYTDSVRDDDDDDVYSYAASPEPEPLVERRHSLKRSSDDILETVDDAGSDHSSHESRYFRHREDCGTPPKRQRTSGSPTYDAIAFNPVHSPTRLRKRSSEELEDDEGRFLNLSKRAKVDMPLSLVESPRSLVSDLGGEVVLLAPPLGGEGKVARHTDHGPISDDSAPVHRTDQPISITESCE
ncbi:hypothetical protein CVT24_005499 [Panaeolus cyanescens]|uniref:Uncharacterized protein n=1 Tax=Panaeolus cyanescens TaxID=181874 RepID=A0A409WVS6_9AGAR|nr:hypothetical protein CVT24_005499 [Panaeolus cyanescens]